jgi:hypothetical protein
VWYILLQSKDWEYSYFQLTSHYVWNTLVMTYHFLNHCQVQLHLLKQTMHVGYLLVLFLLKLFLMFVNLP